MALVDVIEKRDLEQLEAILQRTIQTLLTAIRALKDETEVQIKIEFLKKDGLRDGLTNV